MAITANLYVDQGTDFLIVLDLSDNEDFDINQSEYFCDVKKVFSEDRIFSVEITPNGEDTNFLNFFIDKSKTENIKPGKYYYDVLIKKPSGLVDKLLEGIIFILPTTTSIT
jgi:hypothetical protein